MAEESQRAQRAHTSSAPDCDARDSAPSHDTRDSTPSHDVRNSAPGRGPRDSAPNDGTRDRAPSHDARDSAPSHDAREDPSTDRASDFYPPGPSEAAPSTQASAGYKARVVLVLASLLTFVALYLGLLLSSGYLLYYTLVDMPWLSGKGVILNLGAIAGSAMLFLFLLKGLFHRRPFSSDGLIEITEAEQPRLFAFLRKLCRDAGSALPGKVYLAHDVNAAVAYPRSLLSLVFPIRKNLVIGLGLVSALDLSELKAVLAHEFGHFSQSSMKLGQYVYVANGVVADIVFGRDRWDDALRAWRSVDIRLSFPAWTLTGVVWVLRRVLELAFRGINLANLSLSRQMEFNADLHAVRLAGSDAIVSGLWKVERASLAYQHALSGLASVAEHGKFSDDVFDHVERSLARLDSHLRAIPDAEERLGPLLVKYERGPRLHFTSPVERVSALWESHPPNHEREANAKRAYVASPSDDRPAWALFVGRKALRRALSRVAYEAIGLSPRKPLPSDEVAALIEEERGEMRQADHYHGLYEDRLVTPGDLDALAAELDGGAAESKDALRAAAAAFTGEALKKRMARLADLRGDASLIAALRKEQVKLKKKTAMFRGKERTRSEILALDDEVGRELRAELEALKQADRAFFRYHYVCSADRPELRAELMHRYRFLLEVQDLIVSLRDLESSVDTVVARLQPGVELSAKDIAFLRAVFTEGQAALAQVVRRARDLVPPKLALLSGRRLDRFLLRDDVIEPLSGDSISGQWVSEFLQQFDGVLRRLRKLHFKNLGALLALGERLDPTLFAGPGAGPDAAPAPADPALDT